MRISGAASICVIVSACGGGGAGGNNAGGPAAGLAMFDPALATTPQTLAVVGINDATNGTVTQAGTLTGTAITGTLLAGSVDLNNNRITLGGGGAASVTTAAGVSQQFGFSTGSIFGVAGIPSTSLPSGTNASYLGTMRVAIDDGVVSEVLTGSLAATANFNASRISLSAGSLSSANRSGSLQINNAQISGTRITGGQIALTGNFQHFPTNTSVVHAGQFFGPNGDEIGGAFLKDQPSSTDPLKILGTYSAN